jgi:hypothetical protein
MGHPRELWHALDLVCDTLGVLVHRCRDDEDLAIRLGAPRALAASYVTATVDLTDAHGMAGSCAEVLRRGRERVLAELEGLQASLLADAVAPFRS